MNRELSASERELCQRIQSFSIDAGSPALSFSRRLARENRWTAAYSDRVIREYLRFICLALLTGHTVIPSDQVDQAWHLHLTYTHSYWTRLCGEIAGQPLHHGPSRGDLEESREFVELYDQTLHSYESIFCEQPPKDIWPAADIRFCGDFQSYRVNPNDYWVTPKLRFPVIVTRQALGQLGALAALLSAITNLPATLLPPVTENIPDAAEPRMHHAGLNLVSTQGHSDIFDTKTASDANFIEPAADTEGKSDILDAITVYITIALAFLISEVQSRLIRRLLGTPHPLPPEVVDLNSELSSFTWTDAACLQGGGLQIAEAAVCELTVRGLCRIDEASDSLIATDMDQSAGAATPVPDENLPPCGTMNESRHSTTLPPACVAVLSCLPVTRQQGLAHILKSRRFLGVTLSVTKHLKSRGLVAEKFGRWGKVLGVPKELLLFSSGILCFVTAAILLFRGQQPSAFSAWHYHAFLFLFLTLVALPAFRIRQVYNQSELTGLGQKIALKQRSVHGRFTLTQPMQDAVALAVAVNGNTALSKSNHPELVRLQEWLKPVPVSSCGCCGGV